MPTPRNPTRARGDSDEDAHQPRLFSDVLLTGASTPSRSNDAVKELETLRNAARNDDEALSKIAEGQVNVEASGEQGGDDEGKEPDDEEPGEGNKKGKPKTVKKPVAKSRG